MYILKDNQNKIIGYGNYIGEKLGTKKNNQMIILKESIMSKKEKLTSKYRSCPWIARKRREAVDSGVVLDMGDYYIFNNDFVCTSPNLAACVLLGAAPTDANKKWIDKQTNKSLFETINDNKTFD